MSEEQVQSAVVERMPRMLLNAIYSIRMDEGMKDRFLEVAKGIKMRPQDAGRLAMWEFIKKYEGSDERPFF